MTKTTVKSIARMGMCGILFASTSALAGTTLLIGHVSETLQVEGSFGNCMIKLDGGAVNPATSLPTCSPVWVSLDCSGDFQSKALAGQLLSSAQLSMVTGNRVGVFVDDTKMHNGYCVAYRVDSVNAP